MSYTKTTNYMKNIFIVLFSCLLYLNSYAQEPTFHIYYASLSAGEANPVKEFTVKKYTEKIKKDKTIEFVPNCTFQTIEGIGGAFNENGAEALLSLDNNAQLDIIKNLFDIDKAGFSLCRTAIGASDFSLDAYSYSEVAEDYNMNKFSIERDKKYVIPYIKLAISVNPKLKIFGSPWSPPAWMKENGKMAGVDIAHSKLRTDVKVYKAYAKYFSKYVQAYKLNGIDISRICIQNETDITTAYPNCIMPPSQLLELGVNYIKPEFKKENIKTEIYAGTFRMAGSLEMQKYLALNDASKLDGIGLQYTAPRYITEAQIKSPQMKFMHTEGNCFNGENSEKQAQTRLEEISGYINSNATNYCYWNIILNETTESGWSWKQNSLINIDRKNKIVQYNPDYNVMYLLSKFIKTGDVRIASTSAGKQQIISVKDNNGTIKLIVQNDSETEEGYRFKWNTTVHDIVLPAKAISVIVIQ